MRQVAKRALVALGARVPRHYLERAEIALQYMRLGRWMRGHGFAPPRLPDRAAVFDAILQRVRHERVLYLEFGVYRGASMRYWSERLRHPGAILHGFDSFEGLPEEFCASSGLSRGYFSTGGAAPVIQDSRVWFCKGWFQDTLPGYKVPDHDVLVINLDADLYSSTIYALRHFRDWIRPGTVLYFDELSRVEHEARAFDEFMRESGLRFRAFASANAYNRVAFECVGPTPASRAP